MSIEAQANEVVNHFVRSWTESLAARDFLALADLFHTSALFVATSPAPLIGRHHIRTYYEHAPSGLRAQAVLTCATRPAPDLVHGLLDVTFEATVGISLQGRLGVSLTHTSQGWQVSAYQLTSSRTPCNCRFPLGSVSETY